MTVRFASRLMLVLALVGVVPVLLLGGLSFRANRDELHHMVGGLQNQAATDLARSCRQLVLLGVDNLRLAAGGRVALAVGASGDTSRLLLAELSLAELGRRVEELAAEGGLAFVVDHQGLPVVHARAGAELSREERELVSEGLSRGASVVRTVHGEDGAEYLVAFAPVPDLGWGVVVGRRASEAFAPAEHVRRHTVFWALVSLMATGVLGAVLARGVSQPIARLSEGVGALAAGRYDQRVSEEGRDELGVLARSFNLMAGELQRREAELRRWSEELRQRVDERTRELCEAQDQIARTRRLAALGSFSAGIAHELNNPLTSVLGMLSLMRAEVTPESFMGQGLTLALEQARRMASIIRELRQMLEQERAGVGHPLELAHPVRAALHELREELPSRGVTLVCELAEAVPRVLGNEEQLQKVVSHLLRNALTAMPRGGTLSVETSTVEGDAVCLSVKDTGKGIPESLRERIFDPFFTTKDEPGRVGLGLSVVHRIVEAHHGRIRVESVEGQGTTITIILPAAGGGAHLS